MSRCYAVTFNTPTGYVEVKAYGNIRKTAERTARRKLREMGFDLQTVSIHSIVPIGKR